jgi:5-formyltetrahydrofolate cyclo-ligase
MDKTKLDRISELSRKQRSVGLTTEEKAEQAELRNEYLVTVKRNFRSLLDTIEFEDNELN